MVKEVKKRGYRKIAIIVHEQQGAAAIVKAFLAELKAAGLADIVVINETVPLTSHDFTTLATKVRAAKADATALLLFSEGLSVCAKKLREQGWAGDIFGAETFEDQRLVNASNGALTGAWSANIDEPSQSFTTAYKAKFNAAPGVAAANSYDVLNIFADAIEKVGNSKDEIATYIKNLKNYSGAAGLYSCGSDNRFDVPTTIKLVTKDGFVAISK